MESAVANCEHPDPLVSVGRREKERWRGGRAGGRQKGREGPGGGACLESWGPESVLGCGWGLRSR